jgi:hypothetical protein
LELTLGFGLVEDWLAAAPTAGELRELALVLWELAAAPTVGTETMIGSGIEKRIDRGVALRKVVTCEAVEYQGNEAGDEFMLGQGWLSKNHGHGSG